MKIKKFVINPFRMNCYIYYDKITNEGIIIDPATYDKHEEDEIINFVESKKIKLRYVINTHGHIDHVLGNKFAKSCFNIPLLIHKDDLFLIEDAKMHGLIFGIDIDDVPPPDDFITEGLIIKLNNTEINFIHTPGHSPGGVCIVDYANKNIFCGDIIFKGTIGRTDLLGGNMDVLLNSIKNKLFLKCDNDFILYPGHMEETTIEKEKKYNLFLE
jgi:hydroxyacylglutathione hydrolase